MPTSHQKPKPKKFAPKPKKDFGEDLFFGEQTFICTKCGAKMQEHDREVWHPRKMDILSRKKNISDQEWVKEFWKQKNSKKKFYDGECENSGKDFDTRNLPVSIQPFVRKRIRRQVERIKKA